MLNDCRAHNAPAGDSFLSESTKTDIMKINQLKYPFAILSLMTLVYACKKDSSTSSNTNTTQTMVTLTTQKSTTDALIDDAFGEVLAANTNANLTNQASSPNTTCYTLDVTPADANTWPKTVTVDYGTTGCTGLSGFLHKGKIIYTITNKFFTEGATITATFDNYTVNGYKIEGTYSIHNNGSANGWNITDSLANGKVTYPDGTTWYTKSGSRTWVQTAGQSTITLLDDEYDVTGEGVITNSEGHSLTASTVTALHRTALCANTVSGQLALLYDSIAGVLDFGSGTCDKLATLTIGTKTYNITLP
jgi:hypothetical protein